MKALINVAVTASCILTIFGCEEDVPKNELSKSLYPLDSPIELFHNVSKDTSYTKEYYGMDFTFYVPAGIEELENRPLLFTLSTFRNGSVAGSMLSVIQKYKMIAVAPGKGNGVQLSLFFNEMIRTSYIDSTQIYAAGFSNGGRDVYELALANHSKVKGVVLLDPSDLADAPGEQSDMSVCIVCQEYRVPRYLSRDSLMNAAGVRFKVIPVSDQDHYGILSPATLNEKIECFNFVSDLDD